MRITSTQNFLAGRICATQAMCKFPSEKTPAGRASNNTTTHLRDEPLELHVVSPQLLRDVIDLCGRHAGVSLMLSVTWS